MAESSHSACLTEGTIKIQCARSAGSICFYPSAVDSVMWIVRGSKTRALEAVIEARLTMVKPRTVKLFV